MRNDRTVAAHHPHPALLAIAAALALALPGAASGEEAAHGVTVLLPPSHRAPQQAPAAEPSADDASPAARDASRRDEGPLIVLAPAPPPVPGWGRPAEIAPFRADDGREVIVYYPPPSPMPGSRKLRGVDIEVHRIGQLPEPSRIRSHSGWSDAPTRIARHVGWSADPTRIPRAGSGDALASQSWNPWGARYRPSRIRYHGWARQGGER